MRSRSGESKGPRLFVSGARVTGPLGAPTTDGSFVKDAAEARVYVRKLKTAGVDYVKVDLTLTDDQLRAVIEECRAQGLPLLGHTQNILKAVEMGFLVVLLERLASTVRSGGPVARAGARERDQLGARLALAAERALARPGRSAPGRAAPAAPGPSARGFRSAARGGGPPASSRSSAASAPGAARQPLVSASPSSAR